MLNFRIKWIVAFETVQQLEACFGQKQTCVAASDYGKILWVRDEDGFHAFKNRCPHQGKPLDDCQLNDGYIVCPFHQYHFSIENGRGHGTSMDKYELKIEDGKVWIGRERLFLF